MFSARYERSAEVPGEPGRMLVRTYIASSQCFHSLHASLLLRVGSHQFQLETELLLRYCQVRVRAR